MIEGRIAPESFECAPGLKLAAHERLSKLQVDTLTQRDHAIHKALMQMVGG